MLKCNAGKESVSAERVIQLRGGGGNVGARSEEGARGTMPMMGRQQHEQQPRR